MAGLALQRVLQTVRSRRSESLSQQGCVALGVVKEDEQLIPAPVEEVGREVGNPHLWGQRKHMELENQAQEEYDRVWQSMPHDDEVNVGKAPHGHMPISLHHAQVHQAPRRSSDASLDQSIGASWRSLNTLTSRHMEPPSAPSRQSSVGSQSLDRSLERSGRSSSNSLASRHMEAPSAPSRSVSIDPHPRDLQSYLDFGMGMGSDDLLYAPHTTKLYPDLSMSPAVVPQQAAPPMPGMGPNPPLFDMRREAHGKATQQPTRQPTTERRTGDSVMQQQAKVIKARVVHSRGDSLEDDAPLR
jgi:hypothetical protein